MNKKQIAEAVSMAFEEALEDERKNVMKNLYVSFHGRDIMILDAETELQKTVSFRSLIKKLIEDASPYDSDCPEWFNDIANDFEKYAKLLRKTAPLLKL